MMGCKVRDFLPVPAISLEELAPEDHFYRQVDRVLDLSFVRELVHDCYAPTGRPSLDPVVFFKLQLVMFFEGIRSELGGEDRVDRRVIATERSAVREGDERNFAVVDRTETEESIDAAEASRGLAAAEFTRFVADSIETVADHATLVKPQALAVLAPHRLDWVAQEFMYRPR
jgi:hypothetical protein